MNSTLKVKAIKLRRRGQTYSEILEQVPVAKSTLSTWLHSVSLAKKQKQRLTSKKLAAAQKGWKSRQKHRIEKSEKIKKESKSKVKIITKRELWLIGVALYWAEGAKENESNKSRGLYFSNSDAKMISVYLTWLVDAMQISINRIKFDLIIHENHKVRLDAIIKHWTKHISLNGGMFDKIYFKRHNLSTNRRKTGNNYFGLVRVRVTKSTDLNREISGYIEGVHNCCQVMVM